MNNFKLQMLFALFICLIIWMNLLGWKIVSLFWTPVSVGIFMVPLTFLITDIVAEVFWKKIVNTFIIWWCISLIVIFIFTIIFVYLEPHSRYDFNAQYKIIFGSSLRMIIASFLAFIISQFHDIIAFEWWKKKTNWKYLWLRNNLSTIVSQFIDTFIFIMIAFYQISPKFTFMFIISMSIPYYLFKVSFALIDTPLVYIGVKWLKEDLNNELIKK